jgi:hypothetical protein
MGLALWLAAGTPGEGAERRPGRGPGDRAERGRWALTRMDEVANEGRRCPERLSSRHQVEACEAEFSRRFREYNEIYLEATRE